MSEIRQDPATKEWVIMATERRKKPGDFVIRTSKPVLPAFDSSCPFCPGNESMTLPPVLSYRGDSDTGSWQVRIFNNKFPVVQQNASNSRRLEQQLFLSMEGSGCHEVIVETPVHNKPLALMNDNEVSEVIRAYRERYDSMTRVSSIKSIIVFKNHGLAAGTSIEHSHSEIVATAIVPRHMRIQYDIATSYYDDHGRGLYSDITERELEVATRLVLETEKFVVFHPFASHRPFETWIMPKINQASFNRISIEDIQQLAKVIRITLLKLYRGLENPDYSMVVDSAPVGEESTEFYQWHIRIIPHVGESSGFEIGSGIFINTALPEETASFMRGVKV